jgi:hypothetical protein
MRTALLLAFVLVISGCVQQQQVALTTSVNPSETDWARKDGANTINGFGVLRTVSGEARTCAGLAANVIPDSSHTRERMLAIFGSVVKGTRAANNGAVKFSNEDSQYTSLIRTTRCDGQGNFTFERVPDGTWYVTTSVVWKANPSSPLFEGGSMMQRVEVRGGQTIKVSLP